MLPNEFFNYFPFDRKNATESLTTIIRLLKRKYIFDRLPYNYFVMKLRLPKSSKDLENINYSFPIKDKDMVKKFLEEIQKKYSFTFSFSKEWINIDRILSTRRILSIEYNNIP